MTRIDTRLSHEGAAAEAALWRTLHPDARRICRRVLGAGPDAEEIADAALVDFLQRYVHRLETLPAARSYLRLMAMRRAVRFAARRDRTAPLDADDLVAEDTRSPEALAQVGAMLPRLDVCLGELKPKARAALRLKFEAELSNERIGDHVGGSRQYIGRLITKSLAALRACLERASGPLQARSSTGGR